MTFDSTAAPVAQFDLGTRAITAGAATMTLEAFNSSLPRRPPIASRYENDACRQLEDSASLLPIPLSTRRTLQDFEQSRVARSRRKTSGAALSCPRNRRDYDDIPAGARDKLEFVWLERVR